MTTLITGASSGIGGEFARRFGAQGHDLALVARSTDKLNTLADELRSSYKVNVTVITLDLAAPEGAARLYKECEQNDIEVDVLVNNAGFGTIGDVADADQARLADEIQLNCSALVGSTALFLPAMKAQGRGMIINVGSTAGFQPVPHMAVYAATKAFVLSFTEALWAELKGTGIRVLTVCPGPTDTPFFENAGDAEVMGRRRTTTQLLDNVMRALKSDKPTVVDGFGNAFVARVLTRLMPRRIVVGIAGRVVGH